MISPDRLARARDLVTWLHGQVNESTLPATLRHRVSTACFGIAQEHHSGIVLLLLNRNPTSAIALVRLATEAFVRGSWLWYCATDTQISDFAGDKDPPSTGVMIGQLEEQPMFSDGVLSSLKREHWSAMCSFTHTGGLHVQRWQKEDAIEPSYEPAELEAVLAFAELAGAMSTLIMCNMLGNEEAALRVLAKVASSE